MKEINGLTHPPHFSQFGHFLTETLTRIPISQKKIKQVLFHSYDGDSNYSKIIKYQKELLDLLNIARVENTYPEELSINEQINIINSAQTIAGFSGSALHLSIFSEPGTKIIELGDKRSPQTPNTHQINICKALGLIHEFHSYEVSMKTII